LRKQYGPGAAIRLQERRREPVFSEFEVANPQTKRAYRVAIRGDGLGVNFCSCPDFTVNTLGTCKHVEFVLAKLRGRKGAAAAFAAGFRPAYSEVYLRYGASARRSSARDGLPGRPETPGGQVLRLRRRAEARGSRGLPPFPRARLARRRARGPLATTTPWPSSARPATGRNS